MRSLLLVLLVFLIIGALPVWPYSQGWSVGYFPSGGLLIAALLILFLIPGSGRSVV